MRLTLRDGTEVVVRPIRTVDKQLLARAMAMLSRESARLRFLAPKSKLSSGELRYLTEIDYIDHYALVAVMADDPRRLAAVGRWVRATDDPASAELAIVVGDSLQGQGLGTALGRALAQAARARGVHRFTALVLAENTAAPKLFERISGELHTQVGHGTRELVAELAA